MSRTTTPALLAAALALAGCHRTEDADRAPAPTPIANEAAPAAQPPAPPPPRPAAQGDPSLAPPVLTPEAERSVKGARNILLSFARAIEQGQYDQAWAQLSPTDRRKWSRAQFAAIFADLGKVTVAIPDGKTETVRGQTTYTGPVTVTGIDKDGRPVRMEGTALLRLAADTPGATPTEPRWRFETLSLDWTH